MCAGFLPGEAIWRATQGLPADQRTQPGMGHPCYGVAGPTRAPGSDPEGRYLVRTAPRGGTVQHMISLDAFRPALSLAGPGLSYPLAAARKPGCCPRTAMRPQGSPSTSRKRVADVGAPIGRNSVPPRREAFDGALASATHQFTTANGRLTRHLTHSMV